MNYLQQLQKMFGEDEWRGVYPDLEKCEYETYFKFETYNTELIKLFGYVFLGGPIYQRRRCGVRGLTG